MIYFSLRDHTGFCVNTPNVTKKKMQRGFGTNEVDWNGRVDIRKIFLAVGEACMAKF